MDEISQAQSQIDAISAQLGSTAEHLLPSKVVTLVVDEPQIVVKPEEAEMNWWTRWQLPDPTRSNTVVPARLAAAPPVSKTRPVVKAGDVLHGRHTSDFARDPEFDKYSCSVPHLVNIKYAGFL
jgi:hypothetical protein